MTKFEVGKKYRLKNYPETVYECMYVGSSFLVVKNLNTGIDGTELSNWYDKYEEYKEPVVLTRYVPVIKSHDGSILISQCNHLSKSYNPPNIIDWIEIKYEVKDV